MLEPEGRWRLVGERRRVPEGVGGRWVEGGGLASSAWHIDQMGQPPRLGCLGMCTGQCAVVAVSSKCWRSMLALDMSASAYTIDEANIACVGAGGLLVEARRRTPESAGRRRRSLENVGGACR